MDKLRLLPKPGCIAVGRAPRPVGPWEDYQIAFNIKPLYLLLKITTVRLNLSPIQSPHPLEGPTGAIPGMTSLPHVRWIRVRFCSSTREDPKEFSARAAKPGV